ncbi:MAG: M23 family metallopeptidase, partial [Myxococcaceae bacterium]
RAPSNAGFRVRFDPPATPELALATALHASLRDRTVSTPQSAAALIKRLSKDCGGEEGAVLAAFIGREPARYAAQRVRAEGIARPTLQDLARHLPPGFEAEVTAASDTLAIGLASSLGWPVAESALISSGFGDREHPVLGGVRMHHGIDLPLPTGSQVRAVGEGRVRRASEDATNGRMLVIDHGRGVSSAYLHNSVLLVREGEVVKRGQVISRSGNTGRSTGPHLHYQLEIADRPVDPLAFRGATALTRAPP